MKFCANVSILFKESPFLERFERAATVAPEEAMPHVLLVQARFAVGKYREAVEANAEGMKPTVPPIP